MKLIVSDVDGTLIGDDRRITEDIKRLGELIERYKLPFTIASGRIPARIEELVTRLHIRVPYIGCNGACAKLGDTYLWNDVIAPDCVYEAIELADRLGMSVVYTNGILEYVYRKTPWAANLMEKYHRYDGAAALNSRDLEYFGLQKILIAGDTDSEKIKAVREKLKPYEAQLSIVQYGDGVLDLMPAKSDKGYALKRLAGHLGIEPEDIMAIGDHLNDFGMLTYAGVGAAVANASEELKTAADYVCQKPLAAGVIEAVVMFGLPGEEGMR